MVFEADLIKAPSIRYVAQCSCPPIGFDVPPPYARHSHTSRATQNFAHLDLDKSSSLLVATKHNQRCPPYAVFIQNHITYTHLRSKTSSAHQQSIHASASSLVAFRSQRNCRHYGASKHTSHIANNINHYSFEGVAGFVAAVPVLVKGFDGVFWADSFLNVRIMFSNRFLSSCSA